LGSPVAVSDDKPASVTMRGIRVDEGASEDWPQHVEPAAVSAKRESRLRC